MAKVTLQEYVRLSNAPYVSVYRKLRKGDFQSAQRIGGQWFIDENEPFYDARIKSGQYVGWREKYPARKKEEHF